MLVIQTLGMQRRKITGPLAQTPQRLKNNITKHKENHCWNQKFHPFLYLKSVIAFTKHRSNNHSPWRVSMLPLIPCQLTSPVWPHSQATSGPCSGGEQNCSPLGSYGVFGLCQWLLCPGFVVCFKVHRSHSHSSTSCGCEGIQPPLCFQYARVTHALPASVLCPSWCKCLKYQALLEQI